MRNHLPSHALFITLVIAVIIGITCSMLILSVYQDIHFEGKVKREARMQRDLRSARDFILADSSIVVGPEERWLSLSDDGSDSVLIRRDNWGLYSVATTETGSGAGKKSTTFFFGQRAPANLSVCLYLADHSRPLSLVGNSMLKGDAWLPKGGLRSAFIDGRGYPYPDFISGNVQVSGDTLPPLNQRLLQYLLSLTTNNILQFSDPSSLTTVPDSVTRIFGDTMIVIHKRQPIFLEANKFAGHILIKSDSLIRLGGNSRLEDVIISAPVIEFDSGFAGRVQAVATTKIGVGKNCRFQYPTSLILLKAAASDSQPEIDIGDSCSLSGVVLSYAFQRKDLVGTRVTVGKGTSLTGDVYVSGNLYLSGLVHGTVITDYLFYRNSMTIFENYLVDAVIDRTALSPYFIGPPIFGNSEQNRIVQWVK